MTKRPAEHTFAGLQDSAAAGDREQDNGLSQCPHHRQRDLFRVLKACGDPKTFRSIPGRSINLRLVMSGPLICRTIQSEEKDTSDSPKSLSALERTRKLSGDNGLKIAF